MIDYRQIYLLKVNGSGRKLSARVCLALTVPFAGKFERKLHRTYASDRYADVRRKPWHGYLQGTYKIGISSNATRRNKEFNANPASGKTECFALNPVQSLAVRLAMLLYWLTWQALFWTIAVALCLWLLSEPWA